MIDTRTGDTVATVSESGSDGPVTDRLERVAQHLREKLAKTQF